MDKPPIAISYRPKRHDYLPVVVAAIRRHLGDWPIALVTQDSELPPGNWLRRNQIRAITDWRYTEGANKVRRLWDHHEVLARYFERWIWWHDDMLLLRPVADPVEEFSRPLVRQRERARPNRELSNWDGWLWDTLGFFQCQGIAAPNPVLHTPRLIDRAVLATIPGHWARDRLLFEPTYLLWAWHRSGLIPQVAEGYRKGHFKAELASLETLEREGFTVLCWGRKIDHAAARAAFGQHYPLTFN